MFFWGSYNFQESQQAEHPDRPPLRFPAYLPPSVSVLRRNRPTFVDASATAPATMSVVSTSSSSLLTDAAAVQDALRQIKGCRMQVHHVACGAKHLVAVVSLVPSDDAQQQQRQAPTVALYGMGNNEFGQLGHHVANYTTTLTHLHLEDVMEGTVVSVACGARHTLVCTSTGCVYVTGDNSSHQLGLPGQMLKARPKGGSYAPTFTQLTSLAHILAVYANGNSSFALDRRGQVYSWGEAKFGHLGHNDNGERMDPQTLKLVSVDVPSPQLVRWFERHRVAIVEVAVGKGHMVCRSETDVYTCGEPYFGKLGHGDIDPRLEPTRVEFPARKQVEKLVGIAAGDDHTLVLKENPLIGSIVYFFGKLSNSDGQLRPTIVQIPTTAIRSVVAGRGTFCGAITMEGHLYVWGKHGYPKVYNGTNATAPRAQPCKVQLLDKYNVRGLVSGGTFMVAYAAEGAVAPLLDSAFAAAEAGNDGEPHKTAMKEESTGVKKGEDIVKAEGGAEEDGAASATPPERSWDVVVPHDARVGRDGVGDPDEDYEGGVRAMLRQYLGPTLGAAYIAQLPAHPARSAAPVYAFTHIPVRELARGQKVRLWMTNVYAIGTVVDESPPRVEAASCGSWGSLTPFSQAPAAAEDAEESGVATSPRSPEGKRVKIQWQRDDWDDEVVTLYSQDETLDEENPNRWQPFWFEQDPSGEYVVAKSRK
jgi:alpha-tubulin suppressor-like RCC1 family protein